MVYRLAIYFLIVTPPVVSARQAPPSITSMISDDSLLARHYERGVALYSEHDDTGEAIAEAEGVFKSILQMYPRHAPSLAYLGLIAMERDQQQAADSLFEKALAIDSTCAEARIGRARLMRQRSQWQASYDEMRLAVKLDPSSIFARWELASTSLHKAEAPVTDSERYEAIQHLKKILELDPGSRGAHLDLAQTYEELRRWREAVTHYRKVLRIGQLPEDMDVWVYSVRENLAQCLEALSEHEEAIRELQIYLSSMKEAGEDEQNLKRIERRIQDLRQKVRR